MSLTLLAHPLAPQLDLSTADHPVTQPILAQGRLVAVAPSGDLAAADYHGAMPSSSGGAVLWGNTHFAGLHLGTSYHLDTTHAHDQVCRGCFEGNNRFTMLGCSVFKKNWSPHAHMLCDCLTPAALLSCVHASVHLHLHHLLATGLQVPLCFGGQCSTGGGGP